jgi:hypothetical protein
MDEVDRVAHRVTLSALAGLLGGASLATLKGSSIPRNALSMATSCALVGTACFGFERLSNVAMRQTVLAAENSTSDNNERTSTLLYASHAIGGMVGGGITGALFQHRPIPGMILCTPLMLGIALAEQAFETARKERLSEMHAKSKSSSNENEGGYP